MTRILTAPGLASAEWHADSHTAGLFDDLLQAISGTLDIREVFAKVSSVANRAIEHDLMTMSAGTEDGGVSMYAASNNEGPMVAAIASDKSQGLLAEGTFRIVDDLAAAHDDPSLGELPRAFLKGWVRSGYRSVLGIRLGAVGRSFGLQFWSRRTGAFNPGQVPFAQRIGFHVALAVSHEHLAKLARQAEIAKARAEALQRQVATLQEEMASSGVHGRTVPVSEAWRSVLHLADQVAATETTVLIVGESGTGKEVIARRIHRESLRHAGPFIAMNCAALPEQLLESELFGHERGAFTSAHQAREGMIAAARGGTLFLDEVTEMSLVAQAKFLRLLQEREYLRLGGTRLHKADVRVLAASNRDLGDAVARGLLREDLMYRLDVVRIEIPPLRERLVDVLPLARAFLAEIAAAMGRPVPRLSRDAEAALLEHEWPGNVRELRNAMERSIVLATDGEVVTRHLALRRSVPAAGGLTSSHLPDVERELIARALKDCNGNKSLAAMRLGLSRTQLYGRLRKYSLS